MEGFPSTGRSPRFVIPAHAGIQVCSAELAWIPAFAGMTPPGSLFVLQSSPHRYFRRRARRRRRVRIIQTPNFVLFVLLYLKVFEAHANVIPAKAGIQVRWWCGDRFGITFTSAKERGWIPAFAGMTENEPASQVWLRLRRAGSSAVKTSSQQTRKN